MHNLSFFDKYIFFPQCDQIGQTLKRSSRQFCLKSSANINQLFRPLLKNNFKVKTGLDTFWATFGENLATFSSPSGHAGSGCKTCLLHKAGLFRIGYFTECLCHAKYELNKEKGSCCCKREIMLWLIDVAGADGQS